MKIFTSYYGSKTLDRNRHFLVQVSNSAPKGFEPDVKWEEVVPDWDTLVKPSKDGEITEFTYRTRYNTQLQSSAFSIVLAFESIAKQAAGKDIGEEIKKVLPVESCLSAKQLAVYEIKEDGCVVELPTYDGLPSDDNYLNASLMESNERFNQLLEIEDGLEG